MTLTPLDEHDPRLRQICAEISKAQLRSREQQQEIEALLDFVHNVVDPATFSERRTSPRIVGLSANQVGIMKQICLVDLAIGRRGYSDVHVLINPHIISRSKAMIEKPEGCVNFLTTWGGTRRSRSVVVHAWDRSGNEIELKLTGWPAILMQHEVDHLTGRLFIDRLLDPTHADLVSEGEYASYRRSPAGKWQKFVDVSDRVVL